MEKANKSSGFFKGMIIYAGAFFFGLAVLLTAFYFFLARYEETRPAHIVGKYISSFNLEKAGELLNGLSFTPAAEIQTREEAQSEVLSVLQQSTYAKNKDESTQDYYSYYLMNGDIPVMTFGLKKGEAGRFGLADWAVCDEKLIEASISGSAEFSIPESYALAANGRKVPSGFITEKSSHFKMLDGFYSDFKNLPTLVKYETGPYIGNVEFTLSDETGKDITASYNGEVYCLNNCTDAEKTSLTAFCNDFVDRYVKYTSGYDRNTSGNLLYLLDIVDRNSILYDRLKASQMGFGFAESLGDNIQKFSVENIMNCGGGLYCCDIKYQVETLSRHGTSINDYGYKLLVKQQTDGSYKAVAMSVE